MLIDERTVSQAEHTGLYLRAANGTRFIGSPTAGADGEITTIAVPGGLSVGFTGQGVRFPDGRQLQRIGLAPDGGTTTLILVDRARQELATADVEGRVSHLRWSPDGKRVVFTLGRAASGGGVLQDLYLWDLGVGDNPDPMRITDTGAAFGAEWRGSHAVWEGS